MKQLIRSVHSINRNTLKVLKLKRKIISFTCDLLDGFRQQGQDGLFFSLGSFRLDHSTSFPQRSANKIELQRQKQDQSRLGCLQCQDLSNSMRESDLTYSVPARN